ncbi:hypothetical protein ACQ4PT_021108 [Festuca glaucescens]
MLDEKAVTYVRLNLYPCCPRPDKGLGFKPHSDGNMLTVLLANVAGFQSPVHKVVTNAERKRVSVGAFYTLDPEREVEPATELVSEDRPKRHEKMKTSDYIRELQESLARGERVVDRVKI